MALSSFIDSIIGPRFPGQQSPEDQRRDQQALWAALFAGAPQDQVNITPRVGAPDPSQQSLMNPTAQQVPAQPLMPNMQPMGADNPQLAQRAAAGAYNGPAAPLMQGPQADQLKALLSQLSPETAMPFLSSLLQSKIAPKAPIPVGKDTRLVQQNASGGYDQILGAAPEQLTPNEKVVQTQNDYNALDQGSNDIAKAMAPSDIGLGSAAPGLSWVQRQKAAADEQLKKNNANQPFNDDGSPNTAFQNYERSKVDDRTAAAEKRLADASKIDLTDPGDLSYVKAVANYKARPPSAGRNPAQRKAVLEAALQLNPDYTEAKYDQAAKALRDFGTGKQGDTARSLDVSVAHLDTLRELGNALENGNITLINAAKQAFAEQFGVPAPTNFDAAKSIVADEVAKGVIGGQSAQADRETLAASLRKSGGPKVINGAIDTFQSLLGGQLGGLRNQYKRTTGANDFDEAFLSERTRQALEGGVKSPASAPSAPDADGWTTLPNGIRIREKK